MERFYRLIEELGEHLDLALYIDANHSCQLVFDETLSVQMELDMTGERILLGSFLCDVPPGKFREEILKQALIYNHLNPIEIGTISYVEQNNQLALYAYVHARELTAEKLTDSLALFVEKGMRWKEAIDTGQTHPEGMEKENPFEPKP